MRTAVYIDGFNLYYWLKPTPYRWVNLKLLAANAIQAPGFLHEIVAVKYFIARVKKRGKRVGVLVRGDAQVVSLRKVSHFQKSLAEDDLWAALLPRDVSGSSIRIPAAWASKESMAGIR